MTMTTSAFVLVLFLLRWGDALDAHRHRVHDVQEDALSDLPVEESSADASQCAADVSGESVMIARCRATCLEKFTTQASIQCTFQDDCMMCWDHCGRLKRGPEFLANDCNDEYLCWAGCRAACDFHFPYGLQGAGPGWGLRPTSEASASTPPRVLPPPRFDADGLMLRWKQPTTSTATTTTTTASTTMVKTTTPSTIPPRPASRTAESVAEALKALNKTLREDSPPHLVYIVSARMAPSTGWKELKQTVENWLQLSASSRAAMRAVSVLAVSSEGPVSRSSMCVMPATTGHQGHHYDADETEYYDEDASDEDDDDDDASTGSSPDGSLQRLAQRSFAQLRGTVQNGVLLRALLKDRADRVASKRLLTDDAAQDEDDSDDEDDQEDEEVLIDQRRLDLVHRLLGVPGVARGKGSRGRGGVTGPSGWGLHLIGVWAAAGGTRLPRARVAWTAPRGVSETLVNWAVPALRISGSRVVSGVSQAEVPLVEQHATRVTVGDAHATDVSPALVLQLSVQTDSSAATNAVGVSSPSSPHRRHQDADVPPAPASAMRPAHTPTYEQAATGAAGATQAALWEATLVAVGLVVGAAALCVALLLVAYGVHSRVARCCRGRHSNIHAKSASVEPLNAPDQNNV